MPRRQTFVQQVRGRSEILLVDGGDAFFGSPTTKALSPNEERLSFRDARMVLAGYNYMGYHALGLGPADIQFGVDKLEDFLKDAAFPVVCANLVRKESREPVFRESVVVEVNGVRFGIYGVIQNSLNRVYLDRVLGESYEILDALETTRRVVPELRARSDVVVALSHPNTTENFEVAESVQGVDVLVDPCSVFGNKTVWIPESDYLVERGGVPIVRIDGQGSRVGVFELRFGPEKKVVSYRSYDYPLEPQIFDHPEMATLVGEIKGGRRKSAAVENPGALRVLRERFLGHEICGSCHEEQHAFWKSTAHSRAYASLERDGSQTKYECVECHTVAYGVSYVDLGNVGELKDVQCESCHGVHPGHAENPRTNRMGAVKDIACWGCHNPAFTGKEFDYDAALRRAACPKMEN